ncbi:MAG TPA: sugar phosphate isomerase/epimerase, partial [Pirellulales bacterium]|nr:sugar phosphate isomerase/epimerase [Pirellulales bacterium]
MPQPMTRRRLLAHAGLAAGATAAMHTTLPAEEHRRPSAKNTAFRYCLNTSTVRGQKLGIEQEIDLAAKAGYDAIEPWINEIDEYVK